MGNGSGHGRCPAQIADEMEAWRSTGALDRLNPMLLALSIDLSEFTELVSPKLQRRGLTPREYGPGSRVGAPGIARP